MEAEELICRECGQRLNSPMEFHSNACCVSFKAGTREVVEQLRRHKNYKIMVKLVRGEYRNMTYDSDWQLLLKEWDINQG